MSEPIAPDSIAALKIKLADAVIAVRRCEETAEERIAIGEDCSVDRRYLDAIAVHDDLLDAVKDALAAVRAHPDYREPGDE